MLIWQHRSLQLKELKCVPVWSNHFRRFLRNLVQFSGNDWMFPHYLWTVFSQVLEMLGKSNNRKLSRGSSSSITMDFGPSKFRKRQTKHQSKQRTVLVSSDEEEHSPERFYQNHHKKFKSLLPKYLPNRPRSFRDYLCKVLDIPKTENPRRIDIHSHSGCARNNECALRR